MKRVQFIAAHIIGGRLYAVGEIADLPESTATTLEAKGVVRPSSWVSLWRHRDPECREQPKPDGGETFTYS